MEPIFTSKTFNKLFSSIAAKPQRIALKYFAAVCALLILSASGANAQAPVISYASPQVYNPFIPIAPLSLATLSGSGIPLETPFAEVTASSAISCLAVDSADAFYVGSNGKTVISKIVGNVTVSLGTGLLNPSGIALDNSANVFVADFGNNAIKEILASNGNTNTLLSVTAPKGITVDAQGNAYFCSGTTVYKLPAGGSAAVSVATGFSTPVGVAVDAAGNVYVADPGAGAVIKVLASNGSKVTMATADNALTGVAVDVNDNVYYSDTNSAIMVITTGDGQVFPVCPTLIGHKVIAVDKNANAYTDNGLTVDYVPFGTFTVSTLPAGLSFDHTKGVFSGTPIQITPAANYTVTAYNYKGHGSALVNIAVSAAAKPNISYSTPKAFTVGYSVSVTPVNTGGAVPALHPVVFPGTQAANVTGLAVDAAGNVYAAAQNGTAIVKYSAGGLTSVNIGSGFSNTTGVTLDAAGDVFVVDNGNKAVKEILAGNGSTVTYATGFTSPVGIAIDISGNLYVSDVGKNVIYKVPAGGGTPTVLISGLNSPAGVAVDLAGNIYFVIKGGNAIRELPAGASTSIVLASGLSAPYGVAVDPSGNVFFANGGTGNGVLERIPAGGGQAVTLQSAPSKQPGAIALDANGNIYASDWGNQSIYEINVGYFTNPTLPPGLTIDQNTGVISGVPTTLKAKTNYSVQARNSGGISVATIEITVNPVPSPTLSYTGPQVYAVNSAITPLIPATTIVFNSRYIAPINPTTIATVSGSTGGIAADGVGNLYVADLSDNQVIKIAAVGGGVTKLLSINTPMDVALDAAGDIYVAAGTAGVEKIAPDGTVTGLGPFQNPHSISVDARGDVFIPDQPNLYEIMAGSTTPVSLKSGFEGQSLKCDKDGNRFTLRATSIYEETVANPNVGIPIETGFTNGFAISVDQNGNIYHSAKGGLYEISPGVGVANLLSTGAYSTVDGAGNLYVSTNGTIVKYQRQTGFYISGPLPVGLEFNGVTGVISGTPAVTSPPTNYTITGYNAAGSTKATVNIATVAATNTSLTGLSVSGGPLSPTFATATTSYTVTVPYTTPSITVTPTASGGTSTLLVNGTAVVSGTASAAIPLSVGPNTIGVTVTDNGGTTVSNYTITATRTGNASLASLIVSAGTLSPAFAPGTFSYTATLPAGLTATGMTPTLTDTTGTITINGKGIASGTPSPGIPLAVGSNTITIATTASDGVTTQTYTITVVRPSANANLSALALSKGVLSPALNSTTTSYTASVANNVTSLTVTPRTGDANATVTVNGTVVTSGTASAPINLNIGANVISVVVTAPDGSTKKTYTVTVTRLGTNNANLSGLTSSNGVLSPGFSTNTISYTATVVNGVSTTTIKPTASDPSATIKVNGTTVASGTLSGPIALAPGANTISVVVTASNGTTTKTYTITITRTANINANLSAFKPSKGTISPGFSAAINSYTSSVANNVTSITITPTAADPTATIEVKGVAVTSGAASGAIALAVGSNAINTVVTAQDGKTTKTYTLTITRAPGSADEFAGTEISVTQPTQTPGLAEDGILVHQGVSPNGDGINDFLVIENISQYPDNKLSIMNRNGQLVYQASGYDNSSKVFDGRSNKNGQLQLPGTYFYQLDYTVKGIIKHKTGFLVLKY